MWHTCNTFIIYLVLRVSQDRIKEVGPDRACAEWLLRCGAHVRFKGFDRWQTDYNTLSGDGFNKYRIEMIDATDSAVMRVGFPHLGEFHPLL